MGVGGLDDFYIVYDCRLTVSGFHTKSEQRFTHAVQHPSSPIHQIMPHQIVPTKERPSCKG